MKINVFLIVRDHLRTLRSFPSEKLSANDIITFFVFPVLFAIIAYHFSMTVKDDFYNVSITFFGIFIALLLNIQVAIFGIFLRKWDIPEEGKSKTLVKDKLELRRVLLAEINSNVSYLVLVSCAALAVFLTAYTWCFVDGLFPALSVFIYTHFLLTLLMVIKRMYAAFQKEYS